jgi:hypothetical protein
MAMAAMGITLIPRFDGSQFDVSLPWELVTNSLHIFLHSFIHSELCSLFALAQLYVSAILAVSLQMVGQQWAFQ